MKIIFFFVLFLSLLSSVFAEGQILSNRFDSIYNKAENLFKDQRYKEAFESGLDYVDRSSWNGCKGYTLLSEINKKQNLPTDTLDSLGEVCKKVVLMTLSQGEIQTLKQELEQKESFDLFDVMKLHLVTMARFTMFGNSPKDEIDYKDVFTKLEAYKNPVLSVTKNITLFFHYSFLGEIEKKMSFTSFLEKQDFFYKPIFLIYTMYTNGRTVEGFEVTLKYEDIKREISFYQTAYKNLVRIYYFGDKNYEKYLEHIKNYRDIIKNEEKINVGIWFLDQNRFILEMKNSSYTQKLSDIFGREYINFLKAQIFFSKTGSLESFNASGNILRGITPDKAFLDTLSYYDTNKKAIQQAQKLLDPANYKGLQDLGVKVNIGSGTDIIGTEFIPNVFKNLYFNHKDGIRILPESFFEKIEKYQTNIAGIDPDEFTEKDRPYSLTGGILSNSSQNQTGGMMTGSQISDQTTVNKDKTFPINYIVLFSSFLSFLALIIIYIKQGGGISISKKN